jgi:hypothetical protein
VAVRVVKPVTELLLPCDGAEHRLVINDDGSSRMLDHDERTARSFVAFGAEAPECLVVLDLLRRAEKAYQNAMGKWTHVQWTTKIGGAHLNIRDMTSDDVADRLEAARATERRRLEEAVDALRKAESDLEEVREAMGLSREKAAAYPQALPDRLRHAIDQAVLAHRYEEFLVHDLEEALEVAKGVEHAARMAEVSATYGRRAFIEGDFWRAYREARLARDAALEYGAPPVWTSYVNLLSDLADQMGALKGRRLK